jgi:hypothetical protein
MTMKSPTFAKQTSQGDTSMSACFLKLSAQTVIFSIIEALLIAEMESQPLTGRLAICTNGTCGTGPSSPGTIGTYCRAVLYRSLACRAFQTSERSTTGSVGTRLNASPNQEPTTTITKLLDLNIVWSYIWSKISDILLKWKSILL